MRSVNILVVDDDDDVRAALVDELSINYTVESASSGSDAFEALSTRPYDVVISDLKMPDHDGIEVLDFARKHQRDIVRVLLTGYLDERAHVALLRPDAPYKVGKPWHDEIEIVLKRALEHRDATRQLSASVEDALRLATLDDELAKAESPAAVAELLLQRAASVDGVNRCGVFSLIHGSEQLIVGSQVPKECRDAGAWSAEFPIDDEGLYVLRAVGVGESSRELVSFLAHRAQRRAGRREARTQARPLPGQRSTRFSELLRQATVGALASSLLHDLASIMQALEGALEEVGELAGKGNVPGLAEVAHDASTAGSEAVSLFVAMRKFIRAGEVTPRKMAANQLVQRAVRLAGGYVRDRATLRVNEVAAVEVPMVEPLFLQVLVNLLRNAANASPRGGMIDLDARVDNEQIHFTVTDDGPGVADEIADHMFEPFASTGAEGTGLGLAISAYVMHIHGGSISYRRARGRGACFTASLPLAAAADRLH